LVICANFGIHNIMINGSLIWYLQRTSSLLVLTYTIWLFFSFFTLDGTFLGWDLFTSSIIFKLFTTITIISIVVHAFIGLWTIGTDYLTSRTLGFLSYRLGNYADLIRNSYQILFLFLGLIFLIIVLIIVWI